MDLKIFLNKKHLQCCIKEGLGLVQEFVYKYIHVVQSLYLFKQFHFNKWLISASKKIQKVIF